MLTYGYFDGFFVCTMATAVRVPELDWFGCSLPTSNTTSNPLSDSALCSRFTQLSICFASAGLSVAGCSSSSGRRTYARLKSYCKQSFAAVSIVATGDDVLHNDSHCCEAAACLPCARIVSPK
uniref:Uncharacterized protein n=1 Tax=Anopheles funestus TaxID=62324 RepID=A0A4Y0BIA0_ANOFN